MPRSSVSKIAKSATKRKKPVSRRERADLTIPPSRVEKKFRDRRVARLMSFDASIAFAALVEYFVVDVLAKAADQKRGPGKLEDYDLKRTLTTDDFLHRKFGTGVVCVRGKKRSRPSSPSSSKKSEEKDDEKNAAAATIVSEDETKRKRTKESAKRTSEATSGEKIVKEGASKTTVAAA